MKIKQIKEFVDTYFDTDIGTNRKFRKLHDMRYMFYYLCLKYAEDKTYTEISRAVNKKHCTVTHGLDEFRSLMKSDYGFNEKFTNLENTFLKMYNPNNTPQEYIINPNTQDYLTTISKLKKQLITTRKIIKHKDYKIAKLKRVINKKSILL